MKNWAGKIVLILIFIVLFVVYNFGKIEINIGNTIRNNSKSTFKILSSYENSVVENDILDYAKKIGKRVEFTYMGDLDIVSELNNNSKEYDAVWIANSIWLYMLDNSYLTSKSKSISISPVVFGIKESKAKELDLINKEVTNTDILNLIIDKKIKYVMPSVTKTNSGATAYLGFLSSLAGNPEILTEEILNDEELTNKLTSVFSGVERVSGDESYLEEMFINGSDYDAIIASESSLINVNKTLKSQNKEQLYLIYPIDGVAINDSTFAFIKNDGNKEDTFIEIQGYLLSNDGQKLLASKGQRTWYGGISDNIDKNTFDPNWGIDTTKYLNVTKYPSKKVITQALNLYIEELRKPTHVVFCLDYSGSMNGNGIKDLKNAMSYILDHDEAAKDQLQFSKKDKITVITFSSSVNNIWKTDSGYETDELLINISNETVGGNTALYDAIEDGLNILNNEEDSYTKTIIAMTDGAINVGTFKDLDYAYKNLNSNVPIYSITFGQANERQLLEISNMSNAKVFDGRYNLLEAFKEVRGYN